MAPLYNYVVWLWIIYLSHPWSGEGQALSSLLSNFFPANEHTQTGSWLQIVEVTIIPVGVSVTHSLTCSLFSLPAIIFVPDYFILSLEWRGTGPQLPPIFPLLPVHLLAFPFILSLPAIINV